MFHNRIFFSPDAGDPLGLRPGIGGRDRDTRATPHPAANRTATVNLSILDGPDVIYLDVVESPQRVKLAAAIGQRLPAFCTASGKAILAFAPIKIVQQVLDSGMPRYTQNTLESVDSFIENMNQTRERGFSLSLQEYEEGINAIAVPILDQRNQPIASIAVAGPSYRLTQEKMIEIGYQILATAREISNEVEMATNL